jgi:hypothetical protein
MMGASHRSRTPLKLTRTLRGHGRLFAAAGEAEVDYVIDVYEGRNQQSGSGELEGGLEGFGDESPTSARLRLEDGGELQVTLSDVGPEGATIEAASGL